MSDAHPLLGERLLRLPRSFPSRYGKPVIRRVDAAMFDRTYFTYCLDCRFCHDWCCQYGVDVDRYHYDRILEHADHLEAFAGIPRGRWFTDEYEDDPDVPGGGSMRTRVEGGACVFLNRADRGCLLHAYCRETGVDYHELKSMVDCLFPLTFGGGVLCLADEVDDGSLVCVGAGPTVFRGLRSELDYYFGAEFVAVLDRFEGERRRS